MSIYHAPWLARDISVVESHDPTLVGVTGMVVEETRRTLRVRTASGEVTLPKDVITFIIDSGEWVKLGVPLKNNSPLPFFSSSAWVRSKDPCLWSDGSQEHPLAEMAPGGGVSDLEVWVYVSA